MKTLTALFLAAVLLLGPCPASIFNGPVGSSKATFSDNFTRANESPMSGNWTTPGTSTSGPSTFNLTSNRPVANGSGAEAIVNSVSFAAAQSASITIYDNAGVGVILRRATTAANGYLGYLSGSTSFQLYKIVDNGSTVTLTQIGSTQTVTAFAAGDVFLVSISGYVVTAYRNGTQVATITDGGNTYASGPRVVIYASTSKGMSAFSATDL